MKKILLFALFLPPFAQSIFAVDYFKGNYKAALDSAKKYDKLIFMNIAATWSGASNRMERSIFKDEVVNNQLNSNFLPLRLEASSEEGMIVQKQFGIAALPAYLIINQQGESVRLRIGESSMEAFSTFLVEALNEPKGYESLDFRKSSPHVEKNLQRTNSQAQTVRTLQQELINQAEEFKVFRIIA